MTGGGVVGSPAGGVGVVGAGMVVGGVVGLVGAGRVVGGAGAGGLGSTAVLPRGPHFVAPVPRLVHLHVS